jgi:hypothetical protein
MSYFEDLLHYLPGGELLLTPTPEVFQKVSQAEDAWQKIEARMASDPKIARNLKPLHDHWLEFFQKWSGWIASNDWRDYRSSEVDGILLELGSATRSLPGQASAPNPISGTQGIGSLLRGVGESTEEKTRGTLIGNLTDPRRQYPGGPIDPTKGSPDALCDPCKKDYSSAFCKMINACPGSVGVGDIPWWVWAVGATGVVGFGALAYASYRAAPYVMPIVAPETAPYMSAWQQMRAAEATQSQRR